MTKQEALQELMDLSIDYGTRTAEEIERLDEAVDMAIKALKVDALERQTCDDAVSRADVLETYADLYDVFEDSRAICKELHKVYDRINALPAVQPQRKTDEWCTDCQEYDSEKHCCPRFNRVIRQTLSEQMEWNNHTVACLLAELFGDACACNFNGIDEWLPEKCEVIDACPNPVGVACWEQFLKHRAERRTDGKST